MLLSGPLIMPWPSDPLAPEAEEAAKATAAIAPSWATRSRARSGGSRETERPKLCSERGWPSGRRGGCEPTHQSRRRLDRVLA